MSAWEGSLTIWRQGVKSRWTILPLTPLDGSFCEGKFFLALCFQYFVDGMGEGVKSLVRLV